MNISGSYMHESWTLSSSKFGFILHVYAPGASRNYKAFFHNGLWWADPTYPGSRHPLLDSVDIEYKKYLTRMVLKE